MSSKRPDRSEVLWRRGSDPRRPCNVERCDKTNDADTRSFFDRIGKYIVLFTVLGFVAVFLTLLTVTAGYYLGETIPVVFGMYWNWNSFFLYMVLFVVVPVTTGYVAKAKEKASVK